MTIILKFLWFTYSSSESPSLEYPLFPLELLLLPLLTLTTAKLLLLLELLAVAKEQLEMVGLERWWWTTLVELLEEWPVAAPLLEVLVLNGATELCLEMKENFEFSRQNERLYNTSGQTLTTSCSRIGQKNLDKIEKLSNKF